MTSTISASAERELERRAKRKLAVLRHVEEVSGSVAATCRYYGISHQDAVPEPRIVSVRVEQRVGTIRRHKFRFRERGC